MSKPFLTKHPELRWLMSFEFHQNGSTDFHPKEPENYLKRLTTQQLDVLNNLAEEDRLTAFIMFGDGRIDHAIGGTRYVGRERYKVVRPNTSLALFYKHPGGLGKIELVFYTRYLSISYAYNTDKGKVAKELGNLYKKLDTERDETKRKQLKDKILYNLLKMPPAQNMPAVDKHYYFHQYRRCYFRIAEWYRLSGYVLQPWIGVRDQRGRIPNWLGAENTIHGLIDSNRCWMIFPNFLWLWPWEQTSTPSIVTTKETKYIYTALNKCYSDYKGHRNYRTSGPLPPDIQNCINSVKLKLQSALTPFPNILQSGWTKKLFEDPSRNPVYLDFIRIFAGIRFNSKSSKVKFPSEKKALTYLVKPHSNNSQLTFRTNITIPENTFIKGEQIIYVTGNLAGSTRTITSYNSLNGFVSVNSNFGSKPKANDEFQIIYNNNCWLPGKKIEYVPNYFGRTATNKYWAHVYTFKRNDRFTYDKDDKAKFCYVEL